MFKISNMTKCPENPRICPVWLVNLRVILLILNILRRPNAMKHSTSMQRSVARKRRAAWTVRPFLVAATCQLLELLVFIIRRSLVGVVMIHRSLVPRRMIMR